MPHGYFLEVALSWTIFYGFYYALLRQETFFRWNRAYLLLTLIGGLLLPLGEISTTIPVVTPSLWLPEITVGSSEVVPSLNNSNNLNLSFDWLLMGYFMGVLLTLIQLFLALKRIFFFVRTGNRVAYADYQLVHLSTITTPFSFDRWLFVNTDLVASQTELQQIIQHERAHIKQRHSWDILLIETIRVAFWWCPLVYLYKRSLRSVHEYLADAAVLQTADRQQYGRFLLRHYQPLPTYSVVNHFHSQIKLRIVMITKTPSNTLKQVKYLFFIPIFALVAFLTACEKEKLTYDAADIQKQATTLSIENDGKFNAATEADLTKLKEMYPEKAAELDEIFAQAFAASAEDFAASVVHKEVDIMPRFPGCEDQDLDMEAVKNCAETKMLTFIYENVKYPESARKAESEGTVVIKFVVDKSGRLHSPEIARAVQAELDAEVMRIFEVMAAETVWTPGVKDGDLVNVLFHLPVKFVLK